MIVSVVSPVLAGTPCLHIIEFVLNFRSAEWPANNWFTTRPRRSPPPSSPSSRSSASSPTSTFIPTKRGTGSIWGTTLIKQGNKYFQQHYNYSVTVINKYWIIITSSIIISSTYFLLCIAGCLWKWQLVTRRAPAPAPWIFCFMIPNAGIVPWQESATPDQTISACLVPREDHPVFRPSGLESP